MQRRPLGTVGVSGQRGLGRERGDGEGQPAAVAGEVESLFALFGMRGRRAVGEPEVFRLVGEVDDPAGAGRVDDRETDDQDERQASGDRLAGDMEKSPPRCGCQLPSAAARRRKAP
jgi:hypothetical protein